MQLLRPNPKSIRQLHSLIAEGIDLSTGRMTARPDPFWKGLRDLGTELWLDTGDMEGARNVWTEEFSALTTNNTLLNDEVQKGIYDDLIARAAEVLSGVEEDRQVAEIAFVLNARHGLRLAQLFGGKVSVELHTSQAHDTRGTIDYARRYHRVSRERFIVKVPLTPEGLMATRKLRAEGIPINFTLGFSARQNYLAARFASPTYVNVFLGRLNSYISDNGLGDGKMAGEKATLASQRAVREVTGREPVRQIAASMRSSSQVADLAGVDVFTMPLKVAADARSTLDGRWTSRRDADYPVSLAPGIDPSEVRLGVLWEVGEAERRLADDLDARPPRNSKELVSRVRRYGLKDLFPEMSSADLTRIAADGKIPRHEAWRSRIRRGEAAVDSLLNLAALASFKRSQEELDGRIRGLLRR